MSSRSPLAGLAAVGVVALVALGAGTVFGVGPLAPSLPPDQVTDPREMIARSLQAMLDATAVHLDGAVSGSLPGGLVGRGEATVALDGTVLDVDIRPKDARTRARTASPGLGLDYETVTVWDDAWYRTAADAPWTHLSLGDASAEAGIDINPLTLVDRLRSYLATSGLEPTVTDVACGSATGRCHEVRLDAGADPAMILASMLPLDHAMPLPPVHAIVTLQTDALTLRPARLVLEAASDDRAVVVRLELVASHWDEDLVVEEPSTSPG